MGTAWLFDTIQGADCEVFTSGMVYPHSSKVVSALLGTVLMITARRSTSLIVASAYCMSAKYSGVMFLPCLRSTCNCHTCVTLFAHSLPCSLLRKVEANNSIVQ